MQGLSPCLRHPYLVSLDLRTPREMILFLEAFLIQVEMVDKLRPALLLAQALMVLQ